MTRKRLIAVAVLAIGALAAPARAHVTVNPREATKGSFAKLAFRVPSERPDSGTTKVEVSFPVEHPFQHINVRPAPGWTYKVERQTLATPIKAEHEGDEDITEFVAKITWEGGTIGPGEFEEFEISAGPLPEDTDTLTFNAVQTYASGEIVRWIEEATAGGDEPEHPAPVLQLVAGEDGHGSATAEETTTAAQEEQAGATSNGDDGEGGGNGLSVFALVVAGIALVLSGARLLRDPAAARDSNE